MSRPTVRRSELAGYGYCTSHSRFFWGAAAVPGVHPGRDADPVGVGQPEIGEREVLAAMLDTDAALIADRERILLITDKDFASRPFERSLAEQGITLLRPARKDERARPGEPILKKIRQLVESVNDTLIRAA